MGARSRTTRSNGAPGRRGAPAIVGEVVGVPTDGPGPADSARHSERDRRVRDVGDRMTGGSLE
jgi:hypothetical protein